MQISNNRQPYQPMYPYYNPSPQGPTHIQTQNTKLAMQTLYKHQLDSLMQQKNRQKQEQKMRTQAQKREYNERAYSNRESQKIKQQAYKNYYNMLLNNQEQLQNSYVSPFSIRDNMKDQHIKQSVEDGEQKIKQWEINQKRRMNQMKNMYRSQLMSQIEEKKRMEYVNREEDQRKKEEFRRFGKLPVEIDKYQRQRQLDEMQKYKQDLDKIKNEQDYYRSRTKSEQQNARSPVVQQHHALVNPLPYNIQNPYILRQMNKQSYLASLGQHNFSRQL